MKEEYTRPEVLEIILAPENVIAASSLENPKEGEEWGWN